MVTAFQQARMVCGLAGKLLKKRTYRTFWVR